MLAYSGCTPGFALLQKLLPVDASPHNYFPQVTFRCRHFAPARLACASSPVGSPGSVVGQEDDEEQGSRRTADWKAAMSYKTSGAIFEGKVEGSNHGGLLIRFFSLLGFLPYPLLSPSHSCNRREKTIQEIAKDLVGSTLAVAVVEVAEDEKKLIFSEKEASWLKYSPQVRVGDVFEAVVGAVEEYGAFAHLKFGEGEHHLTGLVHVSELSWDVVADARDVVREGEVVMVKVVGVDRDKCRISLSIKQLEEDPLLETLGNAISITEPESDTAEGHVVAEGVPGLESIVRELREEEGIREVRLGRKGVERRAVSQDLQVWMASAPTPAVNADNHDHQKYTLLARAGRRVQEIHVTAALDQDGVKRAVQRVIERVP